MDDMVDRSTDDVRGRLIRVEENLRSHVKFVEMQRDLDQVALHLQAAKYEDRLTNLNGEAGKIAAVQAESVPREVFISELKAIGARLDEMKTAIDQTAGGRLGRGEIVSMVVAVAVVLSLVVAYFNTR